MTKQEILAASGFNNEKDFYAAYPTPEDYFNSIGQTSPEDNSFAKGGWIQKATASIKRRGTEGVCTGSNFGGPSCRPGTKRYALAKTFRKMAKARKKEDGGMVDMYEDGGEMDAYQLMGMPTPEMYYMGGPTDYEPSYGSGVRSMDTEFNRGYAQGGFIGGPRPMFGRALVNEDGGELDMTDYGPYAYAYADGGLIPIPMFKRGGRFKKFLRKVGAAAYGLGEGVLDTASFGLTDKLTDQGYKKLQKIGGASESEIREQDSLRGYGNIGGAVGGAILNPSALGSAISEGAEGLGEGVSKGSPNSKFAQSVGQWAPTVGNIAGMAVGSFKPSAGALSKASKFAKTDFGKFVKTAKNVGKIYNMAEPTATNLLGGGRGQQPQIPQQPMMGQQMAMGQQGMYNQMPYGGGYGQGMMGGMDMSGLSRRDVRQMTKGLPGYMRRAARRGARRGDFSLLQGMYGQPSFQPSPPTQEEINMSNLANMSNVYNMYRREFGGELNTAYNEDLLPTDMNQPAIGEYIDYVDYPEYGLGGFMKKIMPGVSAMSKLTNKPQKMMGMSPLSGMMNRMRQPNMGRKLGRAATMGLLPSLLFGKKAMGGAVNYPEGLQMDIYAEGGEAEAPDFKSLKEKYNAYLTASPVTKYFSGGMVPHPKNGGIDERGTVTGGLDQDGNPMPINVEKNEANWRLGNGGNFITMNNNKGKLSTRNAIKFYNNNDKLALASIFNNTERRKAKIEAAENLAAQRAMDRFTAKHGGALQRMYAQGGMIRKFNNGDIIDDPSVPVTGNEPPGMGPSVQLGTNLSQPSNYNTWDYEFPDASSSNQEEGGGKFWGALGSALPYAMQLAPALFNIREGLRKPTQVNIDTSIDPELGLIDTKLPEMKIKGEAGRRSITDATKDALALQKYAWRQAGGQGGQAPLIAGSNAAMQAQARALREFEENLANRQFEADFKKALSEAELKRYNAMTQFEKRKFRLNADLSKYGLQAQADAVPSQYMSAGLSNLGQLGNQIIYNQMLKDLYKSK